jgi:hypothetical protein
MNDNFKYKRASIACGFKELGKDKSLYDIEQKINFKEIYLIPGYQASFDTYEKNCLLKVEIAHKALDQKSVLEKIANGLHNRLSKDQIEADLIGKQIITP